jgi:cystathionine beta-lyase family protein involved in aluminum resistance
VRFDEPLQVMRFCQLIQNTSPVDSDVSLEFADLPGYRDQIIMAAGTFVQGSSIELSCDAPLRSPCCAYLQGGLSYEHLRYLAAEILKLIMDHKI